MKGTTIKFSYETWVMGGSIKMPLVGEILGEYLCGESNGDTHYRDVQSMGGHTIGNYTEYKQRSSICTVYFVKLNRLESEKIAEKIKTEFANDPERLSRVITVYKTVDKNPSKMFHVRADMVLEIEINNG